MEHTRAAADACSQVSFHTHALDKIKINTHTHMHAYGLCIDDGQWAKFTNIAHLLCVHTYVCTGQFQRVQIDMFVIVQVGSKIEHDQSRHLYVHAQNYCTVQMHKSAQNSHTSTHDRDARFFAVTLFPHIVLHILTPPPISCKFGGIKDASVVDWDSRARPSACCA